MTATPQSRRRALAACTSPSASAVQRVNQEFRNVPSTERKSSEKHDPCVSPVSVGRYHYFNANETAARYRMAW